jgi:hypothetical protein
VTEAVELGAAKSVRAEVKMGIGALTISGGAKRLLDASFTHNIAEWKPEVSYTVSGDRGALVVRQPANRWAKAWPSGIRYEWSLCFGNDIPIDLDVTLGVGTGSLKLAGMSLNSLSIEGGVGAAQIDLSGDWQHNVDVTVKGGVGGVDMRLPRKVGARVHVDGGLGAIHTSDLKRDGEFYVNSAYGKSAVTIHVRISGGIGEVNLEVE